MSEAESLNDPGAVAAGPAEPRISVVIAAFNAERYLRQTLDSVLAQSLPALEVLVVDDGSRDSTAALAASYGAPVRVLQQPNQGVGRARNRGIREARGTHVCFIDADDCWFPWKLELQAQAVRACPQAGVIFTDLVRWETPEGGAADPLAVGSAGLPPLEVDADLSGWIHHRLMLTCWPLTSTVMVRRDIFDHVGMFDEALPKGEDWDLWLRIANQYEFLRLKAKSTLYRLHPQQENRRLRDVDYRSELLLAAHAKWGLTSADGRSLDARVFRARLARYRMNFGLDHLRAGHKSIALHSFWLAWRHDPWHWKYAALAVAGCLGWKPKP
jgi:glycosyltransferase involved in cell wall biosynthesis